MTPPAPARWSSASAACVSGTRRMLESSASAIAQRLDADALVLDVGGAARPFPRADWILDLIPYEARGQLGWDGDRRAERFGPDTWVQRDICDREPWPFADRQFDFAICSHTLEDVRDPVWAARELQRVAAAGYIEVPALREELTYGIQGPWVGWGHHHWLVLAGERPARVPLQAPRGQPARLPPAARLGRRAGAGRAGAGLLVGGLVRGRGAVHADRRRARRVPGRVRAADGAPPAGARWPTRWRR